MHMCDLQDIYLYDDVSESWHMFACEFTTTTWAYIVFAIIELRPCSLRSKEPRPGFPGKKREQILMDLHISADNPDTRLLALWVTVMFLYICKLWRLYSERVNILEHDLGWCLMSLRGGDSITVIPPWLKSLDAHPYKPLSAFRTSTHVPISLCRDWDTLPPWETLNCSYGMASCPILIHSCSSRGTWPLSNGTESSAGEVLA